MFLWQFFLFNIPLLFALGNMNDNAGRSKIPATHVTRDRHSRWEIDPETFKFYPNLFCSLSSILKCFLFFKYSNVSIWLRSTNHMCSLFVNAQIVVVLKMFHVVRNPWYCKKVRFYVKRILTELGFYFGYHLGIIYFFLQ